MLTNEQLALRKTGIGGSDAAAVLGLSPFATPLSIYHDKKSTSTHKHVTPQMHWGNLMEPVIRNEYEKVIGQSVMLTDTQRHPKYSFMLANLDGIVPYRNLVEIKTSSHEFGWGESGSSTIPLHYKIQCQHYMTITGYDKVDIPVLIGASDFRIYHLQEDKELQALCIEGEKNFWENYILKDIEPSPVTYNEVIEKYGKESIPSSIKATDKIIEHVKDLNAIHSIQKSFEEDAKKIKTEIMKYMGINEILMNDNKPIVTWKMAKASSSFDKATFKKDHPELYSKYRIKGTPSRRFLTKGE